MKVFTPKDLISGCVPLPSKNKVKPEDLVYHRACTALDTETIRLIYSVKDGHVYYIAASAREFASAFSDATPLAAALPGNAGHRGDGAYVLDGGSGLLVCVKKIGTTVESYIGESSEVEAFAQGCAIHRLQASDASASWQGYEHLKMKPIVKMAKVSSVAGVAVAGVALMVALVSAQIHKSGEVDFGRALQESVAMQKADINQAFMDFNRKELGGDRMAEFHQLTSTLLTLNGTLVSFNSEGGVTTWSAEIPLWAANQALPFTGIKTVVDDVKGVVVITKANG